MFRHESRDLLQENGGRGITGSVIAAGAQMSGVHGLVSFSGDGHRHSFYHGPIPADVADSGLHRGVVAVCLAAVAGLEAMDAWSGGGAGCRTGSWLLCGDR